MMQGWTGGLRQARGIVGRVGLLVGAVGVALGLVAACGSGGPGDMEGAGGAAGAGSTDDAGGAAGFGGGAAGGGDGNGSDGTGGQGAEPHDPCDPTVGDCERVILYVSPLGFDGAAGTALDPIQTIGEALERAALLVKLRQPAPVVHACATAGPYVETLHIDAEQGDIALFGGFECELFESSSERAVIVADEASGHRIDGARAATLTDLRLESPDATSAGASSVALSVVESTGVRLVRTELVAGEGAPGADGLGYAAPAEPGAAGNAGTDACEVEGAGVNEGGPAVTTTCDGSPSASVGGSGGPGGISSFPGGNGAPGEPDGGTVGTGEDDGVCMPGGEGDQGDNGTHGAPSGALGRLDEQGYTPPVGEAGTPGEAGEGGGGGGGAAKPGSCRTGASGGSGGGGGCSGAPAGGGQGGGGSFGLVVVDSFVELYAVRIVVDRGGKGGDGGDGQQGGRAGAGAGGGRLGDAKDGTDACKGGDGGRGGRGGSGAGGPGGPAIGLAYTGAAERIADLAVELPSAAPGGKGGTRNAPAGDGLPGLVAASMNF